MTNMPLSATTISKRVSPIKLRSPAKITMNWVTLSHKLVKYVIDVQVISWDQLRNSRCLVLYAPISLNNIWMHDHSVHTTNSKTKVLMKSLLVVIKKMRNFIKFPSKALFAEFVTIKLGLSSTETQSVQFAREDRNR